MWMSKESSMQFQMIISILKLPGWSTGINTVKIVGTDFRSRQGSAINVEGLRYTIESSRWEFVHLLCVELVGKSMKANLIWK